MLATVGAATVFGVQGRQVRVEVHVSNGLPGFTIVGLPDTSCREARDRVRAALLSSDLKWPQRRVTVNLAPSGLRKVGSGLDLAIAVGILVADGQVRPEATRDRAFLGELGLDGALRGVPGMVPLLDAIEASEIVLPRDSGGLRIEGDGPIYRTISNLKQLFAVFENDEPWPEPPPVVASLAVDATLDLADVAGQEVPRLALEVAAAGHHHLLFVGPPGTGKTLLASRIPGILPDLDNEQRREVSRIFSAAGLTRPLNLLRPPFRSPHHGASTVSLVGGGSKSMSPGEISLACHGVLFLDELGEFSVSGLESLRQPLERGEIEISRAALSVTLPAKFLLVAAMNPCPCGQDGGPGSCRCSDASKSRYTRRLSGPLMDRFDLRVLVTRPKPSQLLGKRDGESTEQVRERVGFARQRAESRGVTANAYLSDAQVDDEFPLQPDGRSYLEKLLIRGDLSGRGLRRVKLVAVTLADLERRDPLLDHKSLAAAVSLRSSVRRLADIS